MKKMKLFFMCLVLFGLGCGSATKNQTEMVDNTQLVSQPTAELTKAGLLDRPVPTQVNNEIPSPSMLVDTVLLPRLEEELTIKAKDWHKQGLESFSSTSTVDDCTGHEVAQKMSSAGSIRIQ